MNLPKPITLHNSLVVLYGRLKYHMSKILLEFPGPPVHGA
jgi:hypothetical protein